MKSQRINSHTYLDAPSIELSRLLEVSCNYVIAMPLVNVAVAILEFEIMQNVSKRSSLQLLEIWILLGRRYETYRRRVR